MITYVNTVLVGTGVGTVATSVAAAQKGQYIVTDAAGNALDADTAASAEAIKIGLATGKTVDYIVNGVINHAPVIKWSHLIKRDGIKSFHSNTAALYAANNYKEEDEVTIEFNSTALMAGNRIVVRLTFKDTDTRYRKWTESYEHVVEDGKTAAADVVAAFVKQINVKNAKRARVIASNVSNKLVLTAMKYDDDQSVDTINVAKKVRFNANAWYTVPTAAGFASKNKYNAATKIEKVPGHVYEAEWKLVRDHEAQAMGYEGILNRGEGTWPIVKPAMNTVEGQSYDYFTLEFENMYRTADDLQRRTKETVEVYEHATKLAGLQAIVTAFVKGDETNVSLGTSDVTID